MTRTGTTDSPLLLPERGTALPVARTLCGHLGTICGAGRSGGGIRALCQRFSRDLVPAGPARYLLSGNPDPVVWEALAEDLRRRIALPAMEIAHLSWAGRELAGPLDPLRAARDGLRALLYPGYLVFWSDEALARLADLGGGAAQADLDAACLCLVVAPPDGASHHARLAARSGADAARAALLESLFPDDMAIE